MKKQITSNLRPSMSSKIIYGVGGVFGAAIILSGCQHQNLAPKPSPTSSTNTTAVVLPANSQSNLLPAIPAGWQRFQAAGLTVNLPSSYVAGSSDGNKSDFSGLTDLGLDAKSLAEILQPFVAPAKVFAIDKSTINSKFVTTMMTSIDSGSPAKNIDEYGIFAAKELTGRWEIQQQEKITFSGKQSIRLQAKSKNTPQPVSLVVYITGGDRQFWLTLFTTTTARLDQQILEFDSIVKSLQIN